MWHLTPLQDPQIQHRVCLRSTSSTWSPLCCLQGFYIVSYALGIYNLNLLLGFLTPQIDPEMEGPTLPDKGSDEIRPFVRRLPEFKFW